MAIKSRIAGQKKTHTHTLSVLEWKPDDLIRTKTNFIAFFFGIKQDEIDDYKMNSLEYVTWMVKKELIENFNVPS